MKKYRENVAQFANYRQMALLNPFDAVICLKKADNGEFEIVHYNDKLPLAIVLHDVKATKADRFFTKQCWQQLLKIVQQEFNIARKIELYSETEQMQKSFAVSVQQLEASLIAVILREEQNDTKPYLQFVEQHVCPVLTTDLQGRIIHQNVAATSVLSREHHSLIGLDIFHYWSATM